MVKKPAANKHAGSSIDDFLKEESVFEEFQARAIKEVIAWQRAPYPKNACPPSSGSTTPVT
jgi:hypothetical protein